MNSSRICLPCVQSSSSTITEAAVDQAKGKSKNVLVLKLRGTKKPSISWAANTIDNEDMGKKSSKRKNDSLKPLLPSDKQVLMKRDEFLCMIR